ncbi:hypothetical protein Riv7116_4513 [Rivularia sp. PCC 7116]|uniref:hypothetical protein n=1 Tax=Rivularia sp. PCC 7116 TaxID=373994 RepID=UPI00029ECB16|nr:hypothetical protein [Rivularia sp. PCC 7116]AFY56934.1 hypothetical protein Riv7116_4513 [Rivularia sp. PCC 7116]
MKKEYSAMKISALGQVASITLGMSGNYPDGNSGMGMTFPAGGDDGTFDPDMGGRR